MSETKKKKGPWEILKNPWLSVATMALGVYVGNTWQTFGAVLKYPGDLYLALLTMSVIPIISTSIITGLARMLRSGVASDYLGRLVALFIVTVVMASGLGILAGYIGQPGENLGSEAEAFIGRILLNETSTSGDDLGLWGIVSQMVPANVFGAFSQGQILGVIFVSVMLGGAIGMSRSEPSERFLHTLEGVHESFVRILSWVLYGLPFGLFCMMGGQISTLGLEALIAVGKFVLVFYAAGMIMVILYLMIMRLATGQGFLRILSAVRDPLFVSFSAASSVAPIPIALAKMKKELKQPEDVCDVVIPLSVAMNRTSYAFLFSLTAVFLSQLFDKPLGVTDVITLFVVSAVVGTAAAGRCAAVGVMLVYILSPIGLPASVGMTIYITIGAILDPMVQMLILMGGCANATVIARAKKQPEYEDVEDAPLPDEMNTDLAGETGRY